MSDSPQDWLFILVFFACFFLFTAAEIVWLRRASAADFKRAFLVVSASNVIAITLGFFLSFVFAGVLFAIAFDTGFEEQGVRQPILWAVASVAIISPTILLAVAKRLLLSVAGLSGVISRPWIYSIAASILFHIFVLGVPGVVTYLS